MQTASSTPGKSTALFIGFLITAILGIAAAKAFGVVENITAKRAIGFAFGLLLILAGNILPKIVQPLDAETSGSTNAADRIAGLIFVLTGSIFAGIWVFAPTEKAMLLSSAIGLGGFFIGAALWTAQALSQGAGFNTAGDSKRAIILLLLHAIFWVFAIFMADALWGDASAKWVALVFVVLNGLMAIPLARGHLAQNR